LNRQIRIGGLDYWGLGQTDIGNKQAMEGFSRGVFTTDGKASLNAGGG